MIQIAQVLLFDRHNRLLIYLRDDKPAIPFPNHWDFFGGHVEEGETPEQALVRELRMRHYQCANRLLHGHHNECPAHALPDGGSSLDAGRFHAGVDRIAGADRRSSAVVPVPSLQFRTAAGQFAWSA